MKKIVLPFITIVSINTNAFVDMNLNDRDYWANCQNPSFIQMYLDQKNCVMEADSKSCESMSAIPGTVFGASSGLGFYLLAKKHPSLHDGIKKITTLNEEIPKLVEEVNSVKKSVDQKFHEKRMKLIDKLIEKHKSNARFVEGLKRLKYYPPSVTLYEDEFATVRGEEINKELKKFYDNHHAKEYMAQMKKSTNLAWAEFDSISKKVFVEMPYNTNLLRDDRVLEKVFGQDFKDFKKFKNQKFDEFRADFLKRNPTHNEKSLDNLLRSNAGLKYKDRLVETYYSELNASMEKAYASEPNRPFKFFKEMTQSNLQEGDSLYGLKSRLAPYKLKRPMFRNIVKSGIIGAFGGAAAEIAVNERSKYELKSCKNALSMSNIELEFLNNGSVLFSGSKVRNDVATAPCWGFTLTNPEDVISESIEKFGMIPNGLCKIINKEYERLNNSISKSLKGLTGSCEEKKFTSQSVGFDFTKNNPETSIIIERNEGVFKYVFPVFNNNSIPDLKSAKVYKKNANGEFTLESRYTNDFLTVINQINPSNQVIELGTPPAEGFKSASDQIKFAAERQRRYNSYFNQVYWNYSQSCKGYGNIECEVMDKVVSTLPVIENVKAYCGNRINSGTEDLNKVLKGETYSK